MHPDRLFIDGAWIAASGTEAIDVLNATTEASMASVVSADSADVDRAVDAARRAFGPWSQTSSATRAQLLRRLAGELDVRKEEIAGLIADEVGTPIKIATRIQAQLPVTTLNAYADLLEKGGAEERIGNTLVLREPVGVVAAIAPWNYPLHQVVAKVAPALAAGCTVVVKPSEIAPLTTLVLAEAVHAAGLPPGVLNVVTGRGRDIGEHLVQHRDIDAVSFTGSVAAGIRVNQLAAAGLKRVTLELGGKSANVVLDDADLKTAVKVGVANAFLNGGQTCTAWTRLIVPRPMHDDACAFAREFASGFVPGDPRDPATKLGPMASEQQRDSVCGFIERGIKSGAKLLVGGPERPALPTGYFVHATVFGDVDQDSEIAQEEIFGPVLAIMAHDGDDDAVALANNSRFGLHGAVWSATSERALAVAKRIRTGSVDINGAPYNPLAPFGGYKQSGIGREMGPYGLEDYFQIKAVQL